MGLELIKILIEAVLTLLGFMALIIFNQVKAEIREMSNSVKELNIKVAVVIEQVKVHEKRIGSLEKRRRP